MLHSGLCNVDRVLILSHGEDRNTLFVSVDLELLDCCRTVYVTGNQNRLAALRLQLSCDLRCRCRFTCTLKTCHHDDGNLIARL